MEDDESKLLKLVILGDSTVGKTSIIERYVNEEFKPNFKATLGTNLFNKKIKLSNSDSITLQIWDTVFIYFIY